MNLLITGANGMLATQIRKDIENKKTHLGNISENILNAKVFYTDVNELDITDYDKTKTYIKENNINTIINCAAFTNVDGCETNQAAAFKVNALGARNLALAAQEVNAKLIQVSTDYVFSGQGSTPFSEYDVALPYSVYGKTKLAGEEFIKQYCKRSIIVRTAWLYGYYGPNFVKTIIKAAKQRGSLKVVNDQIGNPTNSADLSHHILKLVNSEEYGVYHCTNNEECSWYDFACMIVKLANVKADVAPCLSDEYKSPTKRPEYSSLENMMLKLTVGDEMRPWQEALESFFERMPQEIKQEIL